MTHRLLITWFTLQIHTLIRVSNIDQTCEQDGTDRAIGLEYNKSARMTAFAPGRGQERIS